MGIGFPRIVAEASGRDPENPRHCDAIASSRSLVGRTARWLFPPGTVLGVRAGRALAPTEADRRGGGLVNSMFLHGRGLCGKGVVAALLAGGH